MSNRLSRFWYFHDIKIILGGTALFVTILLAWMIIAAGEEKVALLNPEECIDGAIKLVKIYHSYDEFIEHIGAENIIDYDNTYESMAIRYTEVCK